MMNEESVIIDITIDESTLKRIQAYSAENNQHIIESIDSIVQEWMQLKDKERLNDFKHVLDDGGLLKELEELTGLSYALYEETSELWLKVKTKMQCLGMNTNSSEEEEE